MIELKNHKSESTLQVQFLKPKKKLNQINKEKKIIFSSFYYEKKYLFKHQLKFGRSHAVRKVF